MTSPTRGHLLICSPGKSMILSIWPAPIFDCLRHPKGINKKYKKSTAIVPLIFKTSIKISQLLISVESRKKVLIKTRLSRLSLFFQELDSWLLLRNLTTQDCHGDELSTNNFVYWISSILIPPLTSRWRAVHSTFTPLINNSFCF